MRCKQGRHISGVTCTPIYIPPVMPQHVQIQCRCWSIHSSQRMTCKIPTRAKPTRNELGGAPKQQVGTLACTHPHLSIQLKHALQEDGQRCHGGEGSIVNTHDHIYYTLAMYIYMKCYMGFCTPRRTKMDSKKNKKIKKI